MTNTEPAALSRCRSNGGTCPLAPPKSASIPRGRSEPSDASKVALPTPSYATATPTPPVASRTAAANSAGVAYAV